MQDNESLFQEIVETFLLEARCRAAPQARNWSQRFGGLCRGLRVCPTAAILRQKHLVRGQLELQVVM